MSKVNAKIAKLQCRTEDDVINHCRDADALLTQYAPITRRVIENLDDVKVIVRYGVGVDNIDLEAATERGIFVANVIYDLCDVADHTVSLILSLFRKIPWVYQRTKFGEWNWKKFHPIRRIKGKTVGIVGFGRVGREVARRLRGFEVKLVAYDPYVASNVFEENQVKKVDFSTLLEESDVITIHVSLTNETRHMIGEKELKMMKQDAILINVSRGAVIDEKALYKALKEKWISAAGLDVLEKEPTEKDNPMLKLDNAIITPHMAWYSQSSLTEIQEKAAEEALRVLSGELPRNLVNKEVLKKLNRT